MIEDSFFIQMNIAHYEGLLTLAVDDGQRAALTRLLAEAKEKLKSEPPPPPLNRRRPDRCEAVEDPSLVGDLR
jgi:hypothetical protein